MKKVAILGCENSHADAFLSCAKYNSIFNDMDFVGVYSEEREAAEKLNEKYGVYVMKSPDEFVGSLDGLIITARHGAKHHEFAKPYISSGIPMFIDKPITITEADGVAFMRELKENGVRICGGSCCPHSKLVKELEGMRESGEFGKIIGGTVRAPVSIDNKYGGWFFYSQHLTEVMCKLFGYCPKSVLAFNRDGLYNFVVRYEDFDVWVSFVVKNNLYAAGISFEKNYVSGVMSLDGCYNDELESFHDILNGGESKISYRDFIAPVYIMNAMLKSINTGAEEFIHEVETI